MSRLLEALLILVALLAILAGAWGYLEFMHGGQY